MIEIRAGEVVTLTATKAFPVDVSAASSVQVGLGSYTAEPAAWVDPTVAPTYSDDGKTLTLGAKLGNGFLNADQTVYLWFNVLLPDGQRYIEPYTYHRLVFVGTGGTPPAVGQVYVQEVVAGTNVTVDATDPVRPVVSSTGGGGGGGSVDAVVAGTAITVDATDPANPVVGVTPGSFDTAAARDTAIADQHTTDVGLFATAAQGAKADSADQAGFVAADKTRLAGTSGTNTGDQDLSGLATASALATEASTARAAESANATAITDEASTARAAEALKENSANKGAASGYAPLDGSSKVPIANLPTGTSSSTVTVGNDSRLTDARTPTAHASTHASAGTDAVSLTASQITSGTIAQARLGTGSGGTGAKFLADDQTYKTPASGGMTDPTTTKGDLIAHGATTTRLPVGSDGSVLRSRSGQTLGVGWSPEYLGPIRPFNANEWRCTFTQAAGSNNYGTSGQLILYTIPIPFDFTLDGLAFNVTTQATAGTIRAVLFSDNGSGTPATGVADSGAISVTTAGVKSATGLAVTGSRGLYWAGILPEGLTGTPALEIADVAKGPVPWWPLPAGSSSTPSVSTGTDGFCATQSGVAGSQIGATFAGSLKTDHVGTAVPMCLWFRFSAVTL